MIALAGQPTGQDRGVAGGDAQAFELVDAAPLPFLRHRQHQPALAEAEALQGLVGVGQAIAAAFGGLLVEFVAADDAEIADAIGDQPGDVVVAYEQQVHRQRFAVAEQLVATLPPAQPAGRQQAARRLGQAAAFWMAIRSRSRAGLAWEALIAEFSVGFGGVGALRLQRGGIAARAVRPASARRGRWW